MITIQRTHTGISYPAKLKENSVFMYVLETFGFILKPNTAYDLAAFAEEITKVYDIENPTVSYCVGALRNLQNLQQEQE